MTFDWLTSTNDDRKLLYQVIRGVVKLSGLTWPDVYRAAFSEPFTPGEGYEDNLRKGRIDRGRAARLHNWLEREFKDAAKLLNWELSKNRKETPEATWESFVAEHGEFAGLQIEAAGPAVNRITTRPREPKAFRFPRWAPFQLSLAINDPGWVAGVQWVEGNWYSLPFSHNQRVIEFSPRNGKATLGNDALVAEIEPGLHRLVVIVGSENLVRELGDELAGDGAVPALVLDKVAQRLSEQSNDGAWIMRRLNVDFVSD